MAQTDQIQSIQNVGSNTIVTSLVYSPVDGSEIQKTYSFPTASVQKYGLAEILEGVGGTAAFTSDVDNNAVVASNKRIILTSNQNTEQVKGLIDLIYDGPDAKAIIRYLDNQGNTKVWLQTHDYLVYFIPQAITAVSTGADTLTVSTNNNFTDNWLVTLTTTGTLPAPLALATSYYMRITNGVITLYPTATDATNITNKIDLTTVGTGVHTIIPDLNYQNNRHQHFSIETVDLTTGKIYTAFSVQHSVDTPEIAFNRAEVVINRNSGNTNGNLFFSGGGGGGQIRHAGTFTLVPNFPTNSSVTSIIGQSTTSGVASIDMGTTGSAFYRYSRNIAMPINTTAQTTAITLDQTHSTMRANATTAPFTVTLPTAVGRAGLSFTIKKTDASANAVTVGTTSSQTIDAATTFVLSTQYAAVTVQSNNTNWEIIAKV